MSVTELKIDQKTLPENGKTIKAHVVKQDEWIKGEYCGEEEWIMPQGAEWPNYTSLWDCDFWEYN